MDTTLLQSLTTADIFDQLDGGEIIPLVAIVGGLFVAITSIVMCTIKTTAKSKQREQTKREIAAYIAEGSMTPEQGERLIRADMPSWERGGKGGCA